VFCHQPIYIYYTILATDENDEECVALLANHKETDLNAQDSAENACPTTSKPEKCFENTALHYAALKGIPHSVAILLNAGSDPNIRNQLGQSSLHCSVIGIGT
jgi:hypothetical protein